MGQRILAVADSNVAADNLHTRLQHFGIESVRVGQGKDAESRPGDMMWKAAQSARVVVATCIGSGMDILNAKGEGGHFHRVIVDECTQACEPAVLVPLGRRCEQVVLIGDHKQLPATVLSKLAQREGLGISLFERMVHSNGLETTILTEQRRMHSSIAEFPNMAFYDSQLVNAADDNALTAVPGFPWPNPECRVSFVDVSSSQGSGVEGKRGFSSYNVGEADAVARTLQGVLRAGYPPQQIVVLTAYLAQKYEIIRAIRDRGLDSYLGAISVDTVDAYQGMEQGLVLFSATRNNETRTLGFLADARRMNVMLTRAKQGLIIFGDGNTLRNSESMQSRWPAWLDWVEQRGAVIASRDLDTGLAAARSTPAVAQSTPVVASTTFASTSQGFQGSQATPVSSPARAASPPAFAPPPPPQAAVVWQQVHSQEHGAHYYWNKETNLTQWEAPPTFAPAATSRGSQHLRCGFLILDRRAQVSLATVLKTQNNVLPCYAIVQQQLRPQIVEEPGRSANFVHSISWNWNGKEAELMDPGQNGALAQWAIGCINQRLEASLELQEEQQEADEAGQGERQRRLLSHTCTWTCPQLEGEFVATGSAHAAAESRQQAMSALYKVLPSSLEELFVKAGSSSSSSSSTGAEKSPSVGHRGGSSAARDRARLGEVNVMHNAVVQKLGIQALSSDAKLPSGETEWSLTWNFWCMQQGAPRTEKAVGLGKSKAEAKAKAHEQMLLAQGHMQNLSPEQWAAVDEVKQALKEFRVLDAATKAVAFMETSGADASSWSLFLPEVLRGVLAEGDSGTLNELLVCALRGVHEQGLPVELWESLLDEASFASSP
ncbi:unnamed protein product [Polarella glacialis]|uniref:WW domain-containing protein n=2 Tax=Polarella glacialis TaxID=89957 RepID=A0A813DIX1_POLGL|nr:unnamed protein product [Polarella glacialis]